MVTHTSRFAAIFAALALAVGMLIALTPATSANASSAAVVCKKKGAKRVVCPTGKLRGPRGPQGVRGATGPAGPAGPAGPGGAGGANAASVDKFLYKAVTNTPTSTVPTALSGAKAEASCTPASDVTLRITATADNGSFFSGAAFDNEFDTGEFVDVVPAAAGPNLAVFSYMSAGGVQTASSIFTANETAAAPLIAGAFNCALFGTLQIA